MRVFISWSGERSRKMAETLDVWLPEVVQYVDAFYSEDDIAKGTRSDEKLAEQLATADFAITCLTPENVNAPWILYETGAVAHRFKSRACPYLLDLEPAQVPPPLGKLQCSRANRADTLKLLRSIDEVSDVKLGDRLPRVFDRAWPTLEEALGAIPAPAEPVARVRRDEGEMLAEILQTMREGVYPRDALIARLTADRDKLMKNNDELMKDYTELLDSQLARAGIGTRKAEGRQWNTVYESVAERPAAKGRTIVTVQNDQPPPEDKEGP